MVGVTLPSDKTLLDRYDALLLDLDGTLHRGNDPIPGAPQALTLARGAGRRLAFVTNNASRTPGQVVDHLSSVGIPAEANEVLTSAQAGARAAARLTVPGAAALVVGGAGIREAAAAEGLHPVQTAEDKPSVVIQGWAPEVGWALLAEGAFALAAGVPWVATNMDLTLPTARGIAPGNGVLVALLMTVSGRRPDVVSGKPEPDMLTEAAGPEGRRALVVGDRLDTDIAGARAAGLDSLLVLTGVSDLDALLLAGWNERPTYVAPDLAGLRVRYPDVLHEGLSWTCGHAHVVSTEGNLRLLRDGTHVEVLRAVCAAHWDLADEGAAVHLGADLRRRAQNAAGPVSTSSSDE